MSEWWTYGLADFLMFSPATYWRLVARMNAAVWPVQCLALAGGLALLALTVRARGFSAQALLLALAWAASGWLFHGMHYAQIFLGAPWLAGASAVQAALLLLAGSRGQAPPGARLRPAPAARGLGALLLAASVVAFPLWAAAAGRSLAQAEVFGLMPDPTALATLGWLLATPQLPPGWRVLLAVVPLLSLALGLATRALLAQ